MAAAMQSSLFTVQRASTVRSQRLQPRRGLAVVRASGEKKQAVQTPAPAYTPLFQLMSFSGPAPELINGRLAMVAFVAALGAELSSGQSVVSQASAEPAAIALAGLVFVTASLIPLATSAKRTFGPFTPAAEMLNGRAAMLGFAALLVAEAVRGSALF
ncbi:Carotene biosynthesis-related CBR [Micractinium conductrix]|uniref:Carotene biosynthesis-related CBR n=1 Tax=Micractinium conductrix TaxID=554055 RepID=A0A2P6V7X7_9CHLO|nr:Carotene biosynthesis-related CBR [Micractinium conductrix]|eukprot:PSC70183.1 Carotene biosynthesis-related CBR [Micractinium conductrix]